MEGHNLPNLHGSEVQISNDLTAVSPFDLLLDNHFDCEYTKRYLRGLNKEQFIENSLKNWAFIVDKNLTISQSKIKGFWDMVSKNNCPKTFEQSLTNRNISTMKESPEMVKGQLFEYYATGQTNYTGDVPDDSVMFLKNGNPTKIGELINYQADLWKKFVRNNNYKRIKTGESLKFSNEFYSISSLPDVICDQKAGSDIIIDLKFGDSEGTFGDFSWNDDKLPMKYKLLLQAKVNKLIYFKLYAKDAPFIFYIANKANHNAKAREIKFGSFEKMIDDTEQIIAETYKGIKFLIDFDLFKPVPEVKFCEFCKVENCSVKTDVPIVKILEV